MKKSNAAGYVRHIENLATIAKVSYFEGEKIYKYLHRVEARFHTIAGNECNGYGPELTEEQQEARDNRAIARIRELVPLDTIFINGDPRGYALKVSEEEAKKLREQGINLYTDWGGYGILAPEF